MKRKRKINSNFETCVPSITDYLDGNWTVSAPETNKWSCEHNECPRIFVIVLDADGQYHIADDACDDLQATCESLEAACNWAKGKVDVWNRVNACYQSLQANGQSLNAALSTESAQRIKNVFKTAQEAVEMPKGFRYTAFRENKSENSVLSTLMYTSAKLDKTQWVMKSALMAQFVGEEVQGSRVGETVTTDAWSFQPNYDPERSDAGRDEFMPKSVDKLYNFRPNPDSTTDPDRQAAYWLVGILSNMIDDILASPPNRVYEYFLADGLLKKKNLSVMDPGGLIRLLNKGVITGPEVLKAKPAIWKKLLEKGFITGEQAYKSQPNQLAWLAIHDYIPVERALKLDPNIERQLSRAGKLDNEVPEDVQTDTASLVNHVADGVLTPQKAWSLNKDVLKPLLEAQLITAQDAYRLDPSILNWMLENHYIGREEATKLKPRIKQEMDRKGVDWESLDADLNSSRKLNADYADGDDEIFYVLVGKDLVLQVAKEDGKWVQFKYWQRDGVNLYLPRRYMGYLEPADIIGWIRKDYPNLRVAEISEDESYDFIEEQERSNDLDSSRKLNSDYDYPDEEGDDLFYVAIDDDLIIKLEKYDGRWYESVEWEGEDAREFRTTTYMGYLTHDDIKTWIRRDFPNAYIREMDEDEYYEFIEEQEYDDDWEEDDWDEDLDSSRKLNSAWEDVDEEDWEYVMSKNVTDFDGFNTTYTWFKNADGTRHIFMLTDDEPDPNYADFECESFEEALEWFGSYEGYEEDLDSSRKLNCRGYEDMSPESFRQAVEMLDPDSSAWDDLDEFCEAVGYYPDDVGGWDEWFSTLDYDNRRTAWDFVSWVLEDLDSARKSSKHFNETGLIDTIKETTLNFLADDPMVNFGKDAEAYSGFEFSYPDAAEGDYSRYRIEVRAEIGYENLMRLAEVLDKIVTKIDPESYFEPARPGILVCILEV